MRIGAGMDLRFDVTVEEFLSFLTGQGLDHLEVKREYLAAHPAAPDPRELGRLCESYDVSLTYHAPFRDWNMGSFNDAARHQGVDRVCETLDAAHQANAVGVVLHGGSVPRRYPERVRTKAGENARKSLEECTAHAMDVGVPLCLENQPHSSSVVRHTTTPEDLEAMIEAVDAPTDALRVTLDVGHAKVNGFSPTAFADRFADRLHVVHLHDNDGTEDSHEPRPDYDDTARSLGAPYNVLEMKSLADIRESVDPTSVSE